mmetsp:Transcript_51401/g.111849  ORF Transcript_51401/g.111849 Transcript_51401/m.111849 type:complete len:203 (+) Transcript_51401:835-1443(+)
MSLFSMPSSICTMPTRLSSSARCSVVTCGWPNLRPMSLSCTSDERTSRRSQLLASSMARVSLAVSLAMMVETLESGLEEPCGSPSAPSSVVVRARSILTIACSSSLLMSSSAESEKKVRRRSPLAWCISLIVASVFFADSDWNLTSEMVPFCTNSATAAAAPPESETISAGCACFAPSSSVFSVPGPPCTQSVTIVTPFISV